MTYVCKQEDFFIADKPRWFVDLSNGERIWQDDERPGIHPPIAWYRLNQYVQEYKVNIHTLYLQFRSHIESPLPSNAPAYYFSKALLANVATTDLIHYYIIGYLDNGNVHLQKWQVPELLHIDSFVIPLEKIEKKWLIINPGPNVQPTDNI